MRVLAFPMFVGVFYACQSNKARTEAPPPDVATAAVIKAMDTAAVAVEEEPVIDPNFKNFPYGDDDSTHYPATLLTTGQFYGEEVAREIRNATIYIMFAGDIDGDTIPDLIIDTSWHYNAEVPTLYLSKPAEKNQLLKVMGMHVTTGC